MRNGEGAPAQLGLPWPFDVLARYPRVWAWVTWIGIIVGAALLVLSVSASFQPDPTQPAFLGMSWQTVQQTELVLGLISWAISVPSLVAQLTTQWWNQTVGEPLRRMKKYFDDALREVIGETVTSASFTYLASASHVRQVVTQLCGPVISRTVELQGRHPIAADLSISLTAREIQEIADVGQILVVEAEVESRPLLPGPETTLGSLIRPSFVCTSYVMQLEAVRQLAQLGLIRVLLSVL